MKNLRFIYFFVLIIFSQASFAQQTDGEVLRSFLQQMVQKSELVEATNLDFLQKVHFRELAYKYPKLDEYFLKEGTANGLVSATDAEAFLKKIDSPLSIDAYLEKVVKNRVTNLKMVLVKNPRILDIILSEEKLNKAIEEAALKEMMDGGKFNISFDQILDKSQENLNKAIAEMVPNLPANSTPEVKKVVELWQANKFSSAGQYLANLPESQLNKMVDQIPDHHFQRASNDIAKSLETLDYSQSSKLQAMLQDTKLDIPNKDMKQLAEALLANYFDVNMPVETKRKILSSVLALSPAAQATKLEQTVLANTDILFQKSIQFFSGKSENPRLREVGNTLKSELTVFSDTELDILLKKNFKPEQLAKLTGVKQVAAASTAVGVLAKYDGKPVFIKIQRPGLHHSLNKDTIRILSLVEDSKGAQAIVRSTSLGVAEELQLKREMLNYEIAELLYHDPTMELTIPKVIKELPSSDRMFVMSLAQGKNVSKINLTELSDDTLKTMQQAYFDSLKRWFERSMSMDTKLGSEKVIEYKQKIRQIHTSYYPNEILTEEKLDKLIYQFNGDLHGGNVFLDFSKDYKHGYLMTWIDWGNAHALTIEQKRGQIDLILGSISRNPKKMMEAMNAITPLTEAQKTQYIAKASEFLRLEAVPNNMEIDLIANRALSIALDLGVDVPEAAVNWGRGKGMLETSLKEITTEMEKRGLVQAKELKAYAPGRAYMDVLKKYLMKNIPSQLISAEIRSNSIVPLKTLGSFIVKQSQYFLSHYCNLRFMSPF